MLLLSTLLAAQTLAPCEAQLDRRSFRRAQKCFERSASTFDRNGSAEAIVAYYGKARALLGRGSHFRSKAALKTVADRWERATSESKKIPRFRFAAADAAWLSARADFGAYLRTTSLTDKRRAATKLVRRYQRIIDIGDPTTTRRTNQRIAEIWFALARAEPNGCARHRVLGRARAAINQVDADPDTTTTLGTRTRATLDQIEQLPATCPG